MGFSQLHNQKWPIHLVQTKLVPDVLKGLHPGEIAKRHTLTIQNVRELVHDHRDIFKKIAKEGTPLPRWAAQHVLKRGTAISAEKFETDYRPFFQTLDSFDDIADAAMSTKGTIVGVYYLFRDVIESDRLALGKFQFTEKHRENSSITTMVQLYPKPEEKKTKPLISTEELLTVEPTIVENPREKTLKQMADEFFSLKQKLTFIPKGQTIPFARLKENGKIEILEGMMEWNDEQLMEFLAFGAGLLDLTLTHNKKMDKE